MKRNLQYKFKHVGSSANAPENEQKRLRNNFVFREALVGMVLLGADFLVENRLSRKFGSSKTKNIKSVNMANFLGETFRFRIIRIPLFLSKKIFLNV